MQPPATTLDKSTDPKAIADRSASISTTTDRSEFDTIADSPELIIEPHSGWRSIGWRELWEYRDLFLFLTWRGIKARYAQSALGIGWAVVQPVMTMLVFTVVFGRWAGIGSDGTPYALFSFCGLVPWTFFAAAVNGASTALVSNAAMVSKIYFPRLVLPFSTVLARMVDLAITSTLLVGMLVVFGRLPGPGVVLVPAFLLLLVMAALGISLWLSSMAVQYRDVAYALTFTTQILMYVSPVIYPASRVPERFRLIYGLNPMAGIIEGLRSALLGTPAMPWDLIVPGALVTVVLFVSGLFYFRRSERLFADVV